MRYGVRALAWCCALLLLALAVPPVATAETKSLATPHTFWDVTEVVEKASPSVVGIVAGLPNDFGLLGGDELLYMVGTGVVYRADGYIVTNAHVVAMAAEVKVVLPDGEVVDVQLDDIAMDSVTDVAVLRVRNRALTPATFADSDEVKVGQLAIAIGNPMGFRLGNTVSVGVISGVGRPLGTGYPFLQTDAAINQGNSGGPLLNGNAEVVGINTLKAASLAQEGLGFAIPANVVRETADTLIREGGIARPWLGVLLQEGQLASLGLANDDGLTVEGVRKGGPSDGLLQVGDKLRAVGGRPVNNLDEMSEALWGYEPGDTVAISIEREGRRRTVRIELGTLPQDYDFLSLLFGWDPYAPPFGGEDDGWDEGDNPDRSTGDEEEPFGIWRELSEEQVRLAVAYAVSHRTSSFPDFAGEYLQQSERVSLFLQTEFMYVATAAYLHQQASDAEASLDEVVAERAREIEGKLRVVTVLPLREGSYLTRMVRVTITQGQYSVAGNLVMGEPDPTIAVTPSGSLEPGFTYVPLLFSFSTSLLDPAEPITVRVEGPDGLDERFTYTLTDLI